MAGARRMGRHSLRGSEGTEYDRRHGPTSGTGKPRFNSRHLLGRNAAGAAHRHARRTRGGVRADASRAPGGSAAIARCSSSPATVSRSTGAAPSPKPRLAAAATPSSAMVHNKAGFGGRGRSTSAPAANVAISLLPSDPRSPPRKDGTSQARPLKRIAQRTRDRRMRKPLSTTAPRQFPAQIFCLSDKRIFKQFFWFV